jgi:hypothetical protein
MDPEPAMPQKDDARAQRAKTIIVIVMAVLIAAPLVGYLVYGIHTGPAQ